MSNKKPAVDGIWPEHPLFPADGDEDPPPIAFINVFRFEPSGPVQVLRTFRAEELTNEEQIANLYGGGMYEIVGRRPAKHDDSQPGNKVRQRRIRIPGESLPLVAGVAGKPAEVATATKTEEPSGGIMGLFLQMQMQMMTMQEAASARREEAAQREADRREEASRRAAEVQAANQQRSSELMMTMMNQSQNTLVTVLAPLLARGSDGGTDGLTKTIEVLKGLGMKLPGAEDAGEGGTNVGEVMRDVADTVQGVAQIIAANKGVGPAAALPQGPAGPGSAASILKPPGT